MKREFNIKIEQIHKEIEHIQRENTYREKTYYKLGIYQIIKVQLKVRIEIERIYYKWANKYNSENYIKREIYI